MQRKCSGDARDLVKISPEKQHKEGKHVHQVNLQRVLPGADVVRMMLMEDATGRKQGKRVSSTWQAFEDRDTCVSSAEDDHWLGYRTEKEPTDMLGMTLM